MAYRCIYGVPMVYHSTYRHKAHSIYVQYVFGVLEIDNNEFVDKHPTCFNKINTDICLC